MSHGASRKEEKCLFSPLKTGSPFDLNSLGTHSTFLMCDSILLHAHPLLTQEHLTRGTGSSLGLNWKMKPTKLPAKFSRSSKNSCCSSCPEVSASNNSSSLPAARLLNLIDKIRFQGYSILCFRVKWQSVITVQMLYPLHTILISSVVEEYPLKPSHLILPIATWTYLTC